MINNILVVKMSAIGDVIHALPVSYALKESFPQAKVTWVVEKAAYDLLTNNPYIDQVLLFEKNKFRSVGGLMRNLPSFSAILKQGNFDAVLDLQGLAKSAAIAYLSGAKTKLGFCNMREFSHLVSRPVCGPNQNGHVVERYLDVARELGCKVREVKFPVHITDKEKTAAVQILKQAGMNIDKSYVILAVGANWPNKRWPTLHYAQLVNLLYENNVIPVIIGGSGDKRLADEIIAAANIPPVDLTGKTTLKQLAYIIKKAKVLVGGDTGPMHLSVGIGTPVIALMGPTDIKRNGPYGTGHIALQVSTLCSGCWKRQCPQQKDCLGAITVPEVYESITTLLR
ncbi:lipopolysaccharide heptosyltransferase 1 [Sporomusaceae bacterium FL31]|nr:lipopolysaccharide heptosyltransferase 1 [Sporomusaceae bacterium FL31]GCE33924.1 lipopolysaccharide heptosyltransferase 1 [Sporomusaceae bacterium]